jgi:hypothetical protein
MPKLLLGAAILACFSIPDSLHAQQADPPRAASRNQILQDAVASPTSQAAWLEFQGQHRGPWRAEWCTATGTPRAIYGADLPLADWRGNSLEEARRHANLLLTSQERLLGLGTSEFRESIGQRIGGNWSFVFDQYFRGVPVVGGRADVRVSMRGRIAMFGSKAWPIAPDFVVTPTLPMETAVAIAWTAAAVEPPANPQPGRARASRLVIWGDVHATARTTPVLAWEVPVSAILADGSGPNGRYFVDAQTGAVLRYENDKHECGDPGCTDRSAHVVPAPMTLAASAAAETPVMPATTADAEMPVAVATPADPASSAASTPVLTTLLLAGWARSGLAANSPVVALWLPRTEVQVGGQTLYTDDTGRVDFMISTATNVTVSLKGQRCALVQGTSAPTLSTVITPGGSNTVYVLDPWSTDEEIAHTTTYWIVNHVNQYCRGPSALGNTPQLAVLDGIQPTVNLVGACNAFYSNNTISFYRQSTGCTNSAFSTIIAHEWGHGLDFEYGGPSYWNGMTEAWADIVSMYCFDTPDIGTGFFNTPSPVRTGNNTHQFPQGTTLHEQGQSFMGFAWKLRDRLASLLASRGMAIVLTNYVVLATIAADADSQPEAVLEVFLADDDDGNLANGTPNYAAIQWAAAQHSLPHPAILPPNDDCAGALTVVDGLNGPYDNTFAFPVMPSLTPPIVLSPDTADLWFVYTTGVPGSLTVSTCNLTTMDSTLQIYSGTCGNLTSLGFSDDVCNTQSQLTVNVAAGTYYIRVGTKVTYNPGVGWIYTPGTFQLSITGPTGGAAAHGYYGAGCTGLYGGFYPYIYGADPKFGTTVPITTDPYFASLPVGLVALGISPFVPGFPLDPVGAPGCQLLLDFLVIETTLRDFTGRFNYGLFVPHNASLSGSTVYAQTFMVSPGANALGLTSTDGLGLTIGN